MADFDPKRLAGKFVVLDGGEGCGKSTQVRRLSRLLDSAAVPHLLVRDPGTTAAGEKIRDLLLDPATGDLDVRCEMLLYMAARAQMLAETIRPALSRGEAVLADRFVSSTLAYQAFGDLTADEIRQVAAVATAGRSPDLTIILDVPTEVAMRRVVPKFVPLFEGGRDPTRDRIEQRPETYHRQVRQRYLAQQADDVVIVDATGDEDITHRRVLDVLQSHLS